MNYNCRYNVESRPHADCMAWGERITLHSSLPQGNVISRDRGGSNWFSATETGEQYTRWRDATHLFMGELAVIRYGLASLNDTECTLGQKEKWCKLLLSPRRLLQWKHSIDIKMVLWIQRALVKSLDEILKSDWCYELFGIILLKGF